ncbi:oligopeptidase B [Lacinutrix sp. Hel_I_90]|uniref:S9 family peptidase n=1 Tax=Lacinutrix sp. Hel_I_90 TaxID=1249999 RepID=UPI0005CA3F5E
MKTSIYSLLALLFIVTSCKTEKKEAAYKSVEIPVAKKIATELRIHNDIRIDDYFWMRLSDAQKNADTSDAQTQDVLDYLETENTYLEKAMGHTKGLQSILYDEIVGRIKKDDQSVPVSNRGYSYYTRYVEGDDYPLYCRKKVDGTGNEEIMLNVPELAKGHAYYGVGSRTISPNNTLMAFGIDTLSRRKYDVYFKDLDTGELLEDVLTNTTGSAVWANDNKTVFYSTKDPVTLRANKIFKHVLGTKQAKDVLVFEEKDETYSTGVYKSKSEAYLMLYSSQTLSTEHQYLDANTPNGEWKVIQPRKRNLEYSVGHFGDYFYIRTNLDAKNFKIVKTPITATAKENWEDIIPHRADVLVTGIDIFNDYLVLEERINGLSTIRIKPWSGVEHYIAFNDPAYVALPTANPDFNTKMLRYVYTSLTTPLSTFNYNMATREQSLLKQEAVLDPNFSPANYSSERLTVTARDGAKVPLSIVYKKGTKKSDTTPLLLYSYGSYGSNSEPFFSSDRLSLLDRGFIYAVAHIRGGQEMGRDWYEDGKLLNKKNTFTDFIDCGEYLVKEGYTSSDHLYALGGSAGGLLMGAVVNMKPELWNGVIAAVPFVDVVSTMLDETIPLTTFEFDEWGNPKEKEYYDYMKSYSPYDNVVAKDYPNIMITTGYWDSQVQYWEPAKWIAKLRALKTDDHLLVMDCNMETGHGGASGRFERYKRTALNYAFMLDLENISE